MLNNIFSYNINRCLQLEHPYIITLLLNPSSSLFITKYCNIYCSNYSIKAYNTPPLSLGTSRSCIQAQAQDPFKTIKLFLKDRWNCKLQWVRETDPYAILPALLFWTFNSHNNCIGTQKGGISLSENWAVDLCGNNGQTKWYEVPITGLFLLIF